MANIGRELYAKPLIILPEVPQPKKLRAAAKKAYHANEDMDANEDDVENLEEMIYNDRIFWQTIDMFQWRNLSDGRINVRYARNIFNGVFNLEKKIFKQRYHHYYEIMRALLQADQMFERNGIISLEDQAKIISHAIAMGEAQFRTLCRDLVLFQYFIDANECQSLDDILPDNIKFVLT